PPPPPAPTPWPSTSPPRKRPAKASASSHPPSCRPRWRRWTPSASGSPSSSTSTSPGPTRPADPASTSGMTGSDPKADLRRYLQVGREALLWKLDGLSEYDVRRPMVPTGTNLLGIVKHVASVEAGYFGETFDRPFQEPLPWFDDGAEPNADMGATAEESRETIVGREQRVWCHSA